MMQLLVCTPPIWKGVLLCLSWRGGHTCHHVINELGGGWCWGAEATAFCLVCGTAWPSPAVLTLHSGHSLVDRAAFARDHAWLLEKILK